MIIEYKGNLPQIDESCYIAETAQIIGQVTIKENANIWFGTVVRGDVSYITIGANTNIQDNCVVHTDANSPTIIGDNVTVGHNAIIHACTIEDEVLIGMGAIILDNAVIGKNTIIGAGSLIPPGKKIPPNSLVMGSPGKVIRQVTDEEIIGLRKSSQGYVKLSKDYK